jgi:hypothetical protein
MRQTFALSVAAFCLLGCKPDAVPTPTPPVQAPAPKSETAGESAPRVGHAYVPPAPKIDSEEQKLKAYIREERIREIEAAKARLARLTAAFDASHVESEAEALRDLGLDSSMLLSPVGNEKIAAYRELKAKARERQAKEIADAQAHLRSLLLGADEKTIAIPVK